MASMTSTVDGHRAAGWFKIIAFAEAVSWVGLLVGMYFKYLGTPRTEIGVKVFGMVHGLVFMAFVITAVLVGTRCQVGGVVLVAGVAGQHRAARQCDLSHMGGADRSARGSWRRRDRPAACRIDVTNLGA